MSVERYANGASTTLAEDLDNSEVGVDVASVAGFPTTGNFRILVGTELMIVTGVSGTTFTVVRGAEGTTAAVHSTSDPVTHIVTAQSLYGVFSGLYGCGFRQPIQAASFVWVNQGTASCVDTGTGLSLLAPKGTGTNLRILKKSAPSTPYSISAVIRAFQYTGNYSTIGLCFRESSSSKIHVFGRAAGELSGGTGLYSTKYTNETTYSADYASIAIRDCDPLILRITDDGTYRKCLASPDGVTWIEIHSIGRTDFLTADEIGFFIMVQQNTWDTIAFLAAWEES